MFGENLEKQFLEFFPGASENLRKYFSPGRVNLIGEHTDYNGGYVFPAALTLGITAIVRPNPGRKIIMRSLAVNGTIEIDLDKPIFYETEKGWGNYPAGITALLNAQIHILAGAEILFFSTLPLASGLSSSAAIETLMYYIICDLSNIKLDRKKMANDCKKAENDFIGVNCGIMDPLAIVMGKAGQAILLDCATQKYEYTPFELGEYCIVIMNTNKQRNLADSKYNERRNECNEALALIQKNDPGIRNLCMARPDQILKSIAAPVLRKRALHAVSENLRVLEAVNALKNNEIHRFGDLLNASHQSLKDYYEVTGFELDTIVNEALKKNECIGARMTGAGFGGCAIALVNESRCKSFCNAVSESYQQVTGLAPEFYITKVGDGTRRIDN